MTFRDIFKSDFLENMSGVTVPDMIVTLALAFALGLLLYFIYRKCYSGVMYSPSFGVTLIALSMITAMLILTVVSNVVLSLGMVGALSIVRFRTAIKEPMDIAFLFWSIAVGSRTYSSTSATTCATAACSAPPSRSCRSTPCPATATSPARRTRSASWPAR